MHKEYAQTADQVLSDLQSPPEGLSAAQAESRLAEYGPNRLREAPKATLLQRFLQQLRDPMLLILMAAAAVSAVTNYLSHEPFTEVLIILAVIFLSFDVFTQNRDGRKQIIDSDGGTETELCSILSDIDGVGAVDVMLQYGEKDQVAGVIVTAEGAGNPVVKNDLIKAVMALFDISSANVEVFEKTSASDMEKDKEEKSNGQ